MIEKISILNVATFDRSSPTVLSELQKVNYIFGANGTGKTTISRIVADAAFSTTCQCTWQNGRALETVVLNRDFVDKNFDQMRGVFTLGEKEKDTEDKINAAKQDRDKEQEKLNTMSIRHNA